jgi:general secretion pathway protein G
VKAARAQLDSLHKALVAYRLDVGAYPSNEQGLAALNHKPAAATTWAGPYLSKPLPQDPWNHAYVYRHPGQRGEFDLLSYGRDGKPGGSGEAADIVY